MLLEICIPSSVVEVGKQDVCISVLKSYRLQKVSLDKSGGFIQSCKLCGHSEAFHISCCKPKPKPRVVLSSLLKNYFFHEITYYKSGLAPIAAMLKYPEPFTSKVRIGEAYQAQVPDWCVETHF